MKYRPKRRSCYQLIVESNNTKKLSRNCKENELKKKYVRWRHKLQSATKEYFNKDAENAIFVAEIVLPLRLRPDDLYGKFFLSF